MRIKIEGIGRYLPKRIVKGEEVDRIIGKKIGWTSDYVGVKERRYVNEEETVSYMAKEAILECLDDANIDLSEVDLICYGGASGEQVIPSTACLIQRQLGLEDSGISCFDINSTCLSFVSALDTVSYMIEAGRYKTAIIVASEIASKAINSKQPESFALFGDGAVAIVVRKTSEADKSRIITARHETYSSGADFCKIVGGGSGLVPTVKTLTKETEDLFKFDMDGLNVFKLSARKMPIFIERLFTGLEMELSDIDIICPHQASKTAMKLIRKKLRIPEEKFISIIENRGNMISASIPMALYEGIKSERIKRGNKVMLIGTSAGLSIGSVVFIY